MLLIHSIHIKEILFSEVINKGSTCYYSRPEKLGKTIFIASIHT